MADVIDAPVIDAVPKPKEKSAMVKAFMKQYDADGKPTETAVQQQDPKPGVPVKDTAAVPLAPVVPKDEPVATFDSPLLASLVPKADPIVEPKVDPVVPAPGDKEQNLANLRKLKEASDARATDLEKQLAQAKASVPSDYETLKQEHTKLKADNDVMAAELKRTNLSALPEFKEKYDNRLKGATDTIGRILSNTDAAGSIVQVLELVNAPESATRNNELATIVGGLDEVSKAKLIGAVGEFDRIREQRTNELANPDVPLKLNQEQQVQLQKQRDKQLEQTMVETFEEAAKEFPWMKKGDNEKLNGFVQDIQDEAMAIWMRPSSVSHQAKFAMRAAMAPALLNANVEAVKQISILSSELAKLRGATPTPKPGAPDKSNPNPAPSGKGLFMHTFNRTMTEGNAPVAS